MQLLTVQTGGDTLLGMKVQASGMIILIVCTLAGCGKSIQDVAGVYKTAEIKKPSSAHGISLGIYYSSTWVLDLAESGTFTLTENKFKHFIQNEKDEPQPLDGSLIAGEWELHRNAIRCSWVVPATTSGLTQAEERELAQLEAEFEQQGESLNDEPLQGNTSGEEVHFSLTFNVLTTGDIVSRSLEYGTLADHGESKPILISPVAGIAKTWFKRVE